MVPICQRTNRNTVTIKLRALVTRHYFETFEYSFESTPLLQDTESKYATFKLLAVLDRVYRLSQGRSRYNTSETSAKTAILILRQSIFNTNLFWPHAMMADEYEAVFKASVTTRDITICRIRKVLVTVERILQATNKLRTTEMCSNIFGFKTSAEREILVCETLK